MDQMIIQQLNAFVFQDLWFDALVIFLAKYLAYILGASIFLFLLINWKKYWPMVAKGLGAAILARFGIVELIRFFWPRTRPFLESNINLLVEKVNQPAFPSGHAAFFFALSLIVYFYNKKAGLLFFIASILICLGRVIVGLHWPSDILAGAVVGIFSAWLVHKFFKS
jgi:undecaprenyl-diphosphatase